MAETTMDRDEAVQLLRGGEDGINRWNNVRERSGAVPELCGVDLSGANLSGCDLSDLDLSGANLFDSNLCGANLFRTDLTDADLRAVGVGRFWHVRFSFRRLPFVLNDTRIRGTRFSPGVADPCSLIRENYTGMMATFHILLLLFFILPYIAKTMFWVGINHFERNAVTAVVAAMRTVADVLDDSIDPDAQEWSTRVRQ